MILPGASLIPRVVSSVRSAAIQAQPCGVDLTLKRVLSWTGAGTIDYDNSRRSKAITKEMPFSSSRNALKGLDERHHHQHNDEHDSVMLKPASYLVEFNETVDVPLDLVGQIFVRSSLFRSGALLSAGVMDSGYKGAMGGLLQVVNPHGLRLYRDARLGQIVFHQMRENVKGYSGTYQGSVAV